MTRRSLPGVNLWRTFRSFDHNAHIFLLMTAVNGITFGIYMLDFNLYAAAIGYSNSAIGVLNAIPAISIFVAGLPAGFFANKIGFRPLLMIGTASMMIALVPIIGSQRPVSLAIFMLLFSIGSSLVWVLSGPIMASLSKPEERVHLFSINAFILTLSFAIGNLIGGGIPEWYARVLHVSANSASALHTSFWVVLLLNIATFILSIFLTVPAMNAHVSSNSVQRSDQGNTRRPWLLFVKLILPTAFIGMGAGAFITFQQLYFHQRFHLSPGPIATIFAISQIVQAVSILAAPALSEQLGKVNTTLLTELSSIPFLLVLGFTYNLTVALPSFYIRGAVMNMNSPVSEALAMDLLPPNQRTTYTSLQNVLGNLGRGGIGPLISGILQTAGGYGAAFSFTAITYAIAAMLYYAFFHAIEPGHDMMAWFSRKVNRYASHTAHGS